MSARPTALTIAGSDSGGGAGIAADLKTFQAHGVWGLVAVTAVTAQNTTGVRGVDRVTPAVVATQIEAVVDDIGVGAAKTGMLADLEIVRTVVATIRDGSVAPLVVDPVLVSKHGDALLASEAVGAMRDGLLPLAALVTPNLPEAAELAGIERVDSRVSMEEAARRILGLGASAVLVKGGHLEGTDSPDCLATDEGLEWLETPRVVARHTHGTGCVLSAAITARLARGTPLREAVVGAKAFVSRAIEAGLDLGSGVGPVDPGAVDPDASRLPAD